MAIATTATPRVRREANAISPVVLRPCRDLVPSMATPRRAAMARSRILRDRVRAIIRSAASRACTPRLPAISRVRIRWPVRPSTMARDVVVAVRASAADSVAVRVRAERSRDSGDSIVRARAVSVPPAATVSVATAVDSRAATAPRATVRHVADVDVAALPARSAVREASPRRPARTVWRSVMNSRR